MGDLKKKLLKQEKMEIKDEIKTEGYAPNRWFRKRDYSQAANRQKDHEPQPEVVQQLITPKPTVRHISGRQRKTKEEKLQKYLYVRMTDVIQPDKLKESGSVDPSIFQL